jgi:hypothetical protein
MVTFARHIWLSRFAVAGWLFQCSLAASVFVVNLVLTHSIFKKTHSLAAAENVCSGCENQFVISAQTRRQKSCSKCLTGYPARSVMLATQKSKSSNYRSSPHEFCDENAKADSPLC